MVMSLNRAIFTVKIDNKKKYVDGFVFTLYLYIFKYYRYYNNKYLKIYFTRN